MKITMTKKEAEILKLICGNNAGYGGTHELTGEEWNTLENKFRIESK